MTIYARETFPLIVQTTTIVEEFKAMIHIKADVPVFAQQLSNPRGHGTINEDRKPLSHYGVQAGDSITVNIVPEMNMPQSFRVEMRTTVVSIEARPYDTVSGVKELLAKQGYSDVKLSYLGEVLEDQHTLAYYQVENELLAFQHLEFPLTIESACHTNCQIVASPTCTVASILPRAKEKCRVSSSDARLVNDTTVLEPESTLASLSLPFPAKLYLDLPFYVYITCSTRSEFHVMVHFFDTVAMLKTEITQSFEELGKVSGLRLFWEMKELEDQERVGKALPSNNTPVTVLKPQEVLITITPQNQSNLYLPVGPQDTTPTLLKRSSLQSFHLTALMHNGKILDEHQPLRLLGVNHGDTLQCIAEYTIQMLDKREFSCQLQVPATVKSLMHVIKGQEHVLLKQQTLFVIRNATTLSEMHSGNMLDGYYWKLLLLLPGQIVLTIKRSDDSSIAVAAALSDTVAALKQRIQEVNSIPSSQQRLYLAEQLLEDDQMLSTYGLADNRTVALFSDDELLLKVHDSLNTVVDFLIHRSKSVKKIKQAMSSSGRFWFHYIPCSNLHLLQDNEELPDSLVISAKHSLPHLHVNVVLEGERLLTIHTCYSDPIVHLYPPEYTIRQVKESFSDHYVEFNMLRLDNLYLDRNLLADTATLQECVPLKCELEYLAPEENYLVYLLDLDGCVMRIGVSSSDKSILALKQKTISRKRCRPCAVKLLYKGKMLKDAYSLENIQPWCQLDLLMPKDWLVWVKLANRPSFIVGVKPSNTVQSLKGPIKAVYPYTEPIHLVAGSILLHDESIISETVLRNGGTVLLHDASSVLVFVHSHLGSSAAFVLPPSASISHLKISIERKLLYNRKHLVLTHNNAETKDNQRLSDFSYSDFLSLDLSLRLAR